MSRTKKAGERGVDDAAADRELFHRLAFEQSLDGIFISEADGRCIAANPRGLQLTGCTGQEVTALQLADFLHREDSTAFPATGEGGHREVPLAHGLIRRKGGGSLPVEIHGRPIAGGRTLTFVRDISERQQNESILRQSEELFRAAFDNAPTGMSIIDGDGVTYLAVNPLLCEMFGYSREELLGNTIQLVTHPDDEQRSREWIRKKITNEPCEEDFEKRYLHRDGHVIWGLVRASWICNDDGSRRMAVAHIQDITERKMAEEEKAKLNAQLIQAQKMEAIGLLASGVAHDFNNLLTAIKGFGHMLNLYSSGRQREERYVEGILQAAERATALTENLLAVSRKHHIEPQPMDINGTIRQTKNILARIIGEDIRIDLQLSDQPASINGDSNQLAQILMNLAANSRDAMPRGGLLTIKTERVEIDRDFIRLHGYGSRGLYVRLTVSDNGSGMDEQTRLRAFEPFFTTKEDGKGTGLGLAMVYGLVRQHNGFVSIYSEVGSGTTFHLYLPALEAEVAVALAGSETQPTDKASGTVLLAEDDSLLRLALTEVLQEQGYTVIEASDGEDAVAKFSGDPDRIDLVLMDVIMPRKYGVDAYETIKVFRPGIKIIFMSGYAGDYLAEKLALDPTAHFIAKPITPKTLFTMIEKLLADQAG